MLRPAKNWPDLERLDMIAIIGCGNTNRSDDGVGIQVVKSLAAILADSWMPEVKLFDSGTAGIEVMFQARGMQQLIVIDACISNSEIGCIFEVPGEELIVEKEPSFNLHDFRWQHALFAGRKIYKDDFPKDITVYLIEAGNVDFGLELSPQVQKSMQRVVEIILDKLRDKKHTNATTNNSISIKKGKIYLSQEIYNKYFAGSNSAALIDWHGQLLLMPVVSEAQGGLLIKVINSRGDRVVDAVDVLRRLQLSEDACYDCAAQWSTEMAGLLLSIPITNSSGSVNA